MNQMNRPDVDRVLGSLKDFQRTTVDYVFNRMYLDPDRTHRFLLADEVGLGKTLVAKGVVAKAIDHLWDKVDRIDIIYICSSGDIARQNIDRLNITGKPDWALASRATMLPTQLKAIQKQKVNFIAFTPGTTFQLSSSQGRGDERVLLYNMLVKAWGLRGSGPKNVFQGYISDHERFRRRLDAFDPKSIEPLLHAKFLEAIAHRDARASGEGRPILRAQFDALCSIFARPRQSVPRENRVLQSQFIGELRSILAATCIRALEPDLVILDEFQRFKDLLTIEGDEITEETALARELFDYTHGDTKTRLLLLSATPYKMYTTSSEMETDDHYSDFLQTMRFLHDDPAKTEKLKSTITEYRRGICRPRSADSSIIACRDALELQLRKVMARTERLAASEDRNGMLKEMAPPDVKLDMNGALTYRRLQQVADQLEHADTIEYWKSAPFLLSFMDDYKLKTDFKELLKTSDGDDLAQTLRGLFLPDRVFKGRVALDRCHGKMNWLIEKCIGAEQWKLLWMPASHAYYTPSGVFDNPRLANTTKQLVFSAWHVVPKAIAGLLSYEAERRMVEGIGDPTDSLAKARDGISPRLQFARSSGRLTGMPILTLLYPSFVLAGIGDPVRLAERFPKQPTSDELLTDIRSTLSSLLDVEIAAYASTGSQPDESWYWAAPILLDARRNPKAQQAWMSRPDLAQHWSGVGEDEVPSDGDDTETAWEEHVDRARSLLSGDLQLGPPPDDLLDVLSLVALGAPGVSALRSVARVLRESDPYEAGYVRDAAGQMAWGFRNLFNLTDVIEMMRSVNSTEPYWRRCIEYCVSGNIQAVLDEYTHVLKESLGIFDQPDAAIATKISEEQRKAIGLRAAPVIVDQLVGVVGERTLRKQRIRSRFAVRFGEDVEVEDKKTNRKDLVRSAFNSPFWPFVLATTSVGQEGLDFHHYCHSVIHWNLPSNPVDLEQREGRVHRYKGHAVRKNVARQFGQSSAGYDKWSSMFDAARASRSGGATDIVPYWVYPTEGGATIERHVPSFPLSKDEGRLRALRRSLVLYRMVFGQPRQDELLGYLLNELGEMESKRWAEEIRIDLSPSS